MPRISFVCIERAHVGKPPVLLIPRNALEVATPYVRSPPSVLPRSLSLIVIVVVIAPEFTIAVNVPVATVQFLIILLFKLMVIKATALLMPINAPLPAFVPEIMLLLEIVSVPLPAVITVIPVYIDAAVPPAVHPVMMLPVIVTLLPEALVIPVNELIYAALPVTRFDNVLLVMDMPSRAPELIAVIGAAAPVEVVISLIVFCEMTLDPALIDITVIAADPPVQLSNVLLLKVLFKLVLLLDQPVITVAPVTVTFEKLLLFWVMADPLAEIPLPEQKVTVPPTPVFENPVTIELLLTV